ncbi:MAG TPA: hypothetical protein VLE73_05155 [Candidatus Saccharimonadales bacterium]|nr:hypothetical protein [Candidatus Saccharimonadales bacterium]
MFGGRDAAQPAEDTGVSAAGVPADQAVASAPAPAIDTPAFLPAPAEPDVPPDLPTAPAVSTPEPSPTAGVAVPEDLLGIKQQALQQLSPLIGHLDQSPEDKFRTTMMMIQASDNQGLIKDAYEAAQQIGDEKVRAQALLDIINEINYFTQQGQGSATATDSSDA